MSAKSAFLSAMVLVACGSRAEPPVAAGSPGPEKSPPADLTAEAAAPSPSSSPSSSAEPPAEKAAPVRREGAYANLDPDDDLVVAPPDVNADCESELARAGVKFQAATLPVHTAPRSKIVCGSPQVVTYLRGPGKIAYSAPPLLTCNMALALASFERILQSEANTLFGSPVARIDQLGTYSCREIAAYPGWVSEHSYANAIDIGRFVLKNGRSIEVLRDFDKGEAPPQKRAGAFLRVVSRRAHDEDVFSHVLTPFFNAQHANHFHLDLSRFRSDGTRPQTD